MTLRLLLTDTPTYDYSTYYSSLYEDNEQDVINHEYARRGDISITLQSPQGTISEILPNRKNDYINTEGFVEWDFMSVHFWGENPQGEWELMTLYKSEFGAVTVSNVSLKLHGTETTPHSVQQTPSHCDSDQCIGGCSTLNGRELCNTCKFKRDLETLNCVRECTKGSKEIGGYCIDLNSTVTTPISRDDQLADEPPYPSSTSTSSVNNDNESETTQPTLSTMWTYIKETPTLTSDTVIDTSPSMEDDKGLKGSGSSTVSTSYCLLSVLTSLLSVLTVICL